MYRSTVIGSVRTKSLWGQSKASGHRGTVIGANWWPVEYKESHSSQRMCMPSSSLEESGWVCVESVSNSLTWCVIAAPKAAVSCIDSSVSSSSHHFPHPLFFSIIQPPFCTFYYVQEDIATGSRIFFRSSPLLASWGREFLCSWPWPLESTFTTLPLFMPWFVWGRKSVCYALTLRLTSWVGSPVWIRRRKKSRHAARAAPLVMSYSMKYCTLFLKFHGLVC